MRAFPILKTLIAACLVAVPLLAVQVHAQTTTVWNPAANPTTQGRWNEGANWTLGTVPGSGDKVVFNVVGAIPCVVNSVASASQLVIGDGGPGAITVAGGGSLTTGNIWTAIGYNNVANLEIQSGGSASFGEHLWIGLEATGDGTLTLNGGIATVKGMFGLGWGGGKGTALIQSGTLNLLQWHLTDSIKGASKMDITGGKVVITGNVVSSLDGYVTSGKLTAYGGSGTVARVFDGGANTTTVTAQKPAWMGPFPATNWPAIVDPTKKVHYYLADTAFEAPNANWNNSLGLLNDGDQVTADVAIKGFAGKRAISGNLNIFDTAFQEWNSSDRIDILVQVYGDIAVLNPADLTQSRHIMFLTGTVPFEVAVAGGDYTTNAYNQRWNWILFSITNTPVGSGPDRKVGSVPEGSVGNVTYGGVNGGTIRLQGPNNNVNNLAVHAIAFGEPGAFGAMTNINLFDVPDVSCGPIPNSNLVGIDLNAGTTNHLQVMNDGDQTVTLATNVGPAADRRKAVIPDGLNLNFGILDEYLGKSCQDAATFKVCVDFYDDPAFAGNNVQFGPEAYALDASGATGVVPAAQLHLMQGTDQWIRRSWTLAGVNLQGVGTSPLTGGPRFISSGGQVAVARIQMAILRTGSHPLAGQDPLAECYSDPLICQNVYSDSVELDLAKDIRNGLDVGTSGGDQFMVTEEAGPANDRRLAVRPSFGDIGLGTVLNFAILDGALGPSTQPNARLAIAVTYYDDPALVGKGFRPQVWKVESGGNEIFNFLQPVNNIVLQGTDKWRDAYWEIGTIKFSGVNQGPQAAARFSMDADARIYVTRVRYAVIRPCGSNAGRNLLDVEKPLLAIAPDPAGLRLSWPYRAPQNILQAADVLSQPWAAFTNTLAIDDKETNSVKFAPSKNTQFFRLTMP